MPHESYEVESVLPSEVAGRRLTIWSMRGPCWLEWAGATPEALAKAGYSLEGVNLDHLAIGIAGRSDTTRDPPYFVYALLTPSSETEAQLAGAVFVGVLGFFDGVDLSSLRKEVLGGKSVMVGDASLLEQSEHQHGQPYFYETSHHLFVVITDERAWAEDALKQLPE